MKKVLTKILITLGILNLFGFLSFADDAFYLPLEAYGLNSVAGHSTYLRTSETISDASVVFEVISPLNESITVSAVANSNGIAQAELSDYYTRVAGDYSVSARLSDSYSNGRQNVFSVYPSDVSSSVSTLTPGEQVVRSSQGKANLEVQLLDDYNNPISDHIVTMISSSNNDEIVANSSTSDSEGKVYFEVNSYENGTHTYTAYDITADKILDARAKIVFFNSSEDLFSNNLQANSFTAYGNSSGSLDNFTFEDIPPVISVGESVNFTISAVDALDQVVTGYLGSVRFSVVSGNSTYVKLPSDYTFTSQDLGTHTFSLAMSFSQPGTYKVEARDIENTDVLGEYIFNVTTSTSATVNNSITISNPLAGTYSNNIQVISGTATSGAKLKIFDNDLEMGSTIADVNGAFSYTSNPLTDGTHNISVAEVSDVGTILNASSIVAFMIDTASPDVMDVILEPEGSVNPGDIVTIKIYPEETLSQAAILFQSQIFELTENIDHYAASLPAPIEFGDYPITLIVVDELGNESRIENAANINVGGVLGQKTNVTLGDVAGLTATPSDHKVTLHWQDLTDHVNPLKHYRVYYGISPNQLTEAVDTFTDATVWYIPNLKNEVEYYFSIVAIDDKGNTSEHFSNIVSSTPSPNVVDVPAPEVEMGTAGGDALDEMEKDVSESGPEITWLLLLSVLGGFFYSRSRKKIAYDARLN